MDKPSHHSHLFTLRLWAEDFGNDQSEWRGKVQHVLSGETYYVRDWSMLLDLLLKMLSEHEGGQRQVDAGELRNRDWKGG